MKWNDIYLFQSLRLGVNLLRCSDGVSRLSFFKMQESYQVAILLCVMKVQFTESWLTGLLMSCLKHKKDERLPVRCEFDYFAVSVVCVMWPQAMRIHQ